MTTHLKTRYADLLDRSLYLLDSGAQYSFINALVRSILQTVAVTALDYCYEEIDDIERTLLPELASSLLAPSDGAPGRIIDTCIPLIQQAGWTSCSRGWFSHTEDIIGDCKEPLNRRVDSWVTYRNNRPGHGVVAQDTIREALAWLPMLSRDLVEALGDLFPYVHTDGALTVPRRGLHGSDAVRISSLRLHDTATPIVIRSIAPRGPSWRVTYQSLDVDSSVEGTFELAQSAPLISLTRLEQKLYRTCNVVLDNGEVWKPIVLLPARQTPVFEGRALQLASIAEWMGDADSRVCNVYGDGGIGKTTLVTEYLHGLLGNEFDPSVWRPEIICFFSAKETRWGPEGLERLMGAVPSVEDAAREIARSYEERLDRTWFSGTSKEIIDRAATLMSALGSKRDSVLLVLDNAETLARNADEEAELGRVISYLGRRLCRVIVTSRRREKMEAFPIHVPPLDHDESTRLLRKLGTEYGAKPLKDAGEATLKRVARQIGGHPLLIDVIARLVGSFSYSIERGVEATLKLAAGDLGTFLYEDAWVRIGDAEQRAFLVVGQLGGTVSGEVVGWACGELSVAHTAVLSAFDETRFGSLLDYGAHYDLSMDAGARAFLTKKFSGSDKATREAVQKAAARVQLKHRQWLAAQVTPINDRVARAFRTDAAKAAHRAAEAHQPEEAVRWFEEAIQADRGNAALLDRFAWYLMKERRDLPRALQIALQSCAADADDADAHFTAGMIYARLANPGQADEMIAKAERLGKAEHLCKLQRAQARSRSAEALLDMEPVEIARIEPLLHEGASLLEAAKVSNPVGTLDAKHEAERQKLARRFDRHLARVDALRRARQPKGRTVS